MSDYYDRIADLSLEVDGYTLERHEMDTSAGFTRVTTVVELHGPEHVGRGEDVGYETDDHDALLAAHRAEDLDWDLVGSSTVEGFSTALESVDLFPHPPTEDRFRHYRRWAVESAALDLALRQADTHLGAALGRSYDPVRFVVSTRLDTDGEPSAERVHEWLDVDPSLEFKLDPTGAWDRALFETLAATDSVRVLDFKNYYEGTDVDTTPDSALYRRAIDALPAAVLEDVKLTAETRDALAGVHDRLAWDYPVTGVPAVRALPVEPRWLNVKPSRFGTVASLLDTIEFCEHREITMYGGGQYELDVGREHLHALASVFYPESPNDVAPRAYNRPDPAADVPPSPLSPPAGPLGLRWH